MAVRAQTSIEFLLILSAVILVVLAGVMSLSEIMKMQQSAYSTAQGGVENASSSFLNYASNETFGTGFYPVSEGFGNYTNASLVSLELTKSEPYFVNQPAIIQLTSWNDYPNPMQIPKLLIWVVNSSGNETSLSTSEEDNVTVIFSHTLTATFIPEQPGVYNVSAAAQDENGSILINPNTNESVLVTANFTVLSVAPPSNGAVKTFNIDKTVVVKKGADYTETFSLPDDAVIYSAVLEITDSHLYEAKSAGAQASYYLQQSYVCTNPSLDVIVLNVKSSTFFSQPDTVEIPANSFITSANYSTNKVSGDNPGVYINGVLNPYAGSVVKPGVNTISVLMPYQLTCPTSGGFPYEGDYTTASDAALTINYYAPAVDTSEPSDTIGSIRVKTENSTVSAPPVSSVIDLSNYLQGGYNELWFQNIQGSFSYKLVVTYA